MLKKPATVTLASTYGRHYPHSLMQDPKGVVYYRRIPISKLTASFLIKHADILSSMPSVEDATRDSQDLFQYISFIIGNCRTERMVHYTVLYLLQALAVRIYMPKFVPFHEQLRTRKFFIRQEAPPIFKPEPGWTIFHTYFSALSVVLRIYDRVVRHQVVPPASQMYQWTTFTPDEQHKLWQYMADIVENDENIKEDLRNLARFGKFMKLPVELGEEGDYFWEKLRRDWELRKGKKEAKEGKDTQASKSKQERDDENESINRYQKTCARPRNKGLLLYDEEEWENRTSEQVKRREYEPELAHSKASPICPDVSLSGDERNLRRNGASSRKPEYSKA